MPEAAFQVQRKHGPWYVLTQCEAETLYVDLRTEGTQVSGTLKTGFAWIARSRLDGRVLGLVRVVPMTSKDH